MMDLARAQLAAGWRAWSRFWFATTDSAPYDAIRLGFGLIVFFWSVTLLPDVPAFFGPDGLVEAQPDIWSPEGWGVLRWFNTDVAVYVLVVITALAGLALALGWHSRIMSVVVFIAVVSLFRRHPWIFNSGDALIRIVAFYVVFMPCGRRWALDARRRPERSATVTLWPLRLMQIQLSIIYVGAVWAKLRGGVEWNDGTAVSYALQMGDLQRFAVPDAVSTSVFVAAALTYGTLALELALGVLVWVKKLRPWVLLAGVSLHVGIDLTLRVGWFSWTMILMYLAFVPAPTIQWAMTRAGALLLAARRRATANAPSLSASSDRR